MALEKKTGLLYELLIRGHFDETGKLGEYKGGHLITADAIVDSDTGEVISYKTGPAQPISEDFATKYFGEQFAQFNSGFLSLKSERDAAVEQVEAVRSEVAQSIDRSADGEK